MEEDRTSKQDEFNVSLQPEATCTVDAKALEENGGDLDFPFSAETQVSSLSELGKRAFNIHQRKNHKNNVFSGSSSFWGNNC